jgi:hypothetical protein
MKELQQEFLDIATEAATSNAYLSTEVLEQAISLAMLLVISCFRSILFFSWLHNRQMLNVLTKNCRIIHLQSLNIQLIFNESVAGSYWGIAIRTFLLYCCLDCLVHE